MSNSDTVPLSTLSDLTNMANAFPNTFDINSNSTMIQRTAGTPFHSFPSRLLRAAALALLLLAAGAGSALAQRSTEAPNVVEPLKDARETIAEASETAGEMAERMKELKTRYNRKREALKELEEGTNAHSAKFEEVRALHSEMMAVRNQMLEKLQAAYGSAIGSLDRALQTKGEGEGLAKHLRTRAEETQKEIGRIRKKGEKLAVLQDHGTPDQSYGEFLEQKLETLRHKIRVKKRYVEKTEKTAEQARGSSQRALYDKLRALRASLKRRQVDFKMEQQRLVDLARVGNQGLSVRQNLASFRQFWAKMKEMSKTLSGASGLAESIYEDMARPPSVVKHLPDPEDLPKGVSPLTNVDLDEGPAAGDPSGEEIDFKTDPSGDGFR